MLSRVMSPDHQEGGGGSDNGGHKLQIMEHWGVSVLMPHDNPQTGFFLMYVTALFYGCLLNSPPWTSANRSQQNTSSK